MRRRREYYYIVSKYTKNVYIVTCGISVGCAAVHKDAMTGNRHFTSVYAYCWFIVRSLLPALFAWINR